MKEFLSLLIVFIFALLAPTLAHASFPLAYVGEPDLMDVSLSPDGQSVVSLRKDYVYQGGRETWHKIKIEDLATRKTLLTHQVEGRVYFEITWISDDTILARGRQLTFKKRKTYAEEVLVAINPIKGTFKTIFSMPKVKKFKDLKPFKLHQYSAVTDEVAISYPTKKGTQLATIAVSTAHITLKEMGPEATEYWLLDDSLNAHMRVDQGATENIRHYYKRMADGEWKRVHTIDLVDADHREIRVSNDGLSILVLSRAGDAETKGIYTFDVASQTYSDAIYAHPTFDIAGVKMATYENVKLYATWWDDGLERHWFDPTLKSKADILERKLNTDDNWRIVETNSDQSTWLIYISAPTNPGTYSVWDSSSEVLHTIDSVRPELNENTLSKRKQITYTAQDGLALTGYFTPSLRNPETAPLVVIPHGGPVSRDRMDWDGWSQFLAFRGYHVFQPNFRGSGGYGRTFEFMGHGQWGLTMQSDIEDGVEALLERGFVSWDADRAIIGASYGGYAALMAAVRTPRTYQCVGSINGVSNVISMLDHYDTTDPIEARTRSIWVRRIGDPKTDQAALEAISPALNADKIYANIMLIHGTDDDIVPFAQSVEMRDAAEAANVSVMFKRLPGVGHSYWNETVNTNVLADIDTFLMRCLPRTWRPQ